MAEFMGRTLDGLFELNKNVIFPKQLALTLRWQLFSQRGIMVRKQVLFRCYGRQA